MSTPKTITFKVEDGCDEVWLRVSKDHVEMIAGRQWKHTYSREFFDQLVEEYLVEGAKVRE